VLDAAGNLALGAALEIFVTLLAPPAGNASGAPRPVDGGAAFNTSARAASCPWSAVTSGFMCSVCAAAPASCGAAQFQALRLDRKGPAYTLRCPRARHPARTPPRPRGG